MIVIRAGVLAVALAVGGCAAVDLPFQSEPEPQTTRTPTAVETIPTGTADPLPPASLLSDNASDQQASAALTPPPPIAVNDNPNQFLEKDGLAVNAALGAPDFIRRDGPAEVWQYTGRKDGANCILDVYLYSDTSLADSQWVRYVELRGATSTRVQKRACFADMLRRQIQEQAG